MLALVCLLFISLSDFPFIIDQVSLLFGHLCSYGYRLSAPPYCCILRVINWPNKTKHTVNKVKDEFDSQHYFHSIESIKLISLAQNLKNKLVWLVEVSLMIKMIDLIICKGFYLMHIGATLFVIDIYDRDYRPKALIQINQSQYK